MARSPATDGVTLATKLLFLTDEIGRGGFGVVYAGVYKNETTVAVKTINHDAIRKKYDPSDSSGIARASEAVFKTLELEATLMQLCAHTNIVPWVDSIATGEKFYLVMEHLDGGDLSSFLISQAFQELAVAMRIKIALGIAQGLAHIHQLADPVIHHDLKPGNVLLDGKSTPKLCDFGLAVQQSREHYLNGQRGTLAYSAPEALESHPPKPSIDIWAFGIILWRLVTGRTFSLNDLPKALAPATAYGRTKKKARKEAIKQIFRDRLRKHEFRLVVEDTLPTLLVNLLKRCLAFYEDERPTAKTIVEVLSTYLTSTDSTADDGMPITKQSAIKLCSETPSIRGQHWDFGDDTPPPEATDPLHTGAGAGAGAGASVSSTEDPADTEARLSGSLAPPPVATPHSSDILSSSNAAAETSAAPEMLTSSSSS